MNKASEKKPPRISVNKLAEYLEAIPTRRKKIVNDAKYPEKFIVTRYKDAKEGMKGYIRQVIDEDAVLAIISTLESKTADTEFQENDNRLSIEALESLLETDISIFDGCSITEHEDKNELINIAGVDVSVNPDLVIKKEIEGVVHIGAMKLHVSKTNQLTEESQKIVSVLLFQYADKYIKGSGEAASLKLCFSYDLFKQQIECCPTSYKHRLKKIEAACEEIALWWGKL